jgi:hypothetical protein
MPPSYSVDVSRTKLELSEECAWSRLHACLFAVLLKGVHDKHACLAEDGSKVEQTFLSRQQTNLDFEIKLAVNVVE